MPGEHMADVLRRDRGVSDEQVETLRGLGVIERAAQPATST
jgi:predicted transcriptional regulator